jgi:hypothetical protein
MKTKKQRRQWWNSLTTEQQSEYVEKRVKQKEAKRYARMLKESKNLNFGCKKCIHGVTKSCTYNIKGGCKDFAAIEE